MIAFYDVDSEYVDFLKTIDSKVPNIKYDGNNKFVCGIVFKINNIEYYAPVSHMKIQQRTNMLIYKDEEPISSIRFSFMFPAFSDVLKMKDFSEIAKENPQYANLLYTEYKYCITHEREIIKNAQKVYKIGCNKNHTLNYTCCDFKKLEAEYVNYKNEEKQSEVNVEDKQKSTTPESAKQTTEQSINSTKKTVDAVVIEEEIIETTTDPEPVTSPQQEVAATTDQAATDQSTTDQASSDQPVLTDHKPNL